MICGFPEESPNMKHALASLAFALASCALLAQDTAPLTFDVASVKPNRSGENSTHIGHNGGTLTVTKATPKYFILRAYCGADAQVPRPPWLATEPDDIGA